MKNIINPYDAGLNMCFGCGKKNSIGLKLRFTESDDYLHASWQPAEIYEGYPNVLHGGIIATLLDEIGAWCVSVKIGTAGVTSEMHTKYLNPVYINKGTVSLKAKIEEHTEKNAKIICQLFDGRQKLCAESVAKYFIYPEEIARKRFRYPGRDAFYEKKTY
jgi:uncharacterized protein (TIGR00369 family)